MSVQGAVSGALKEARERIIEDWYARVSERAKARNLPKKAVLNNIAGILDDLIEALAARETRGAVAAIPARAAEEHGRSRLDLGYGLAELGEEYNSLREALLEAVDQAAIRLDNDTAKALHGAVDQAHRLGVERYIRLQQERLKDMQSEFLARLVHDFRGPLSTALNSIELLRKRGFGTPADLKNLNHIELAARRVLFLVDGELATSQAMTGSVHVQPEDVDVKVLVDQCLDILRPRFEAKNIEMVLALPSSMRVRSDGLLLGQVLQNLIENAVKYTPEGGRVTIEGAVAQGGMTLSVSDTGRGIAQDLLPLVFDMYHRTERISPGRGIGLSVVKTLIDAMGGNVQVESQVGRGSRFTITLPHATDAEKRVDPPAQRA